MLHSEHTHILINHLLKNKELDEFYISFAIRTIAVSLISIFVPIYLLNLGFNLSDVSIYFIISYLSIALTFPLAMTLNSKIGMKKNMSLGTVSLIAYYLALSYIPTGVPYQLVAIISGVSVSLYYAGYHVAFTGSLDKKNEGQEISILKSISILLPAFGPLIGSIFIVSSSFKFSFIIASIILLISIFPLSFTEDKKTPKINFSLKKILSSDTKKKALCYQADGIIKLATTVFWPIFIFLVLKEVISVGIIISVASIITVIFILIIGKMSDNNGDKTLTYGTFLHASSWILRLIFVTPFGILLNDIYGRISGATIDIPFYKKVYCKAEGIKNIGNYFMFREINLEIGRVILLLIALFTGKLELIFISAFAVTFIYLIIIETPFERISKLLVKNK